MKSSSSGKRNIGFWESNKQEDIQSKPGFYQTKMVLQYVERWQSEDNDLAIARNKEQEEEWVVAMNSR